MSAQPNESPVALSPTPSGDDGPVAEVVAGFESRHLELVEDEEELFALEEEPDDELDALPDEADDVSGDGPTGGADAGEVTELRPGFDAASLEAVEGDEELNALEGADALPGETSLTDQPSKAPSRKVKAAGLGGLVAALPVSLIAALDTISVSEPVLTAIGSALTLLGALAAAYLARERTPAP